MENAKTTVKVKVKVMFTLEQAMKAQRYSYTLSLISALNRRVVNATPRPLYPRERPGTHCIERWVVLRAVMDG